jgi:hypothetical protein
LQYPLANTFSACNACPLYKFASVFSPSNAETPSTSSHPYVKRNLPATLINQLTSRIPNSPLQKHSESVPVKAPFTTFRAPSFPSSPGSQALIDSVQNSLWQRIIAGIGKNEAKKVDVRLLLCIILQQLLTRCRPGGNNRHATR